jgi:hypothetical protein
MRLTPAQAKIYSCQHVGISDDIYAGSGPMQAKVAPDYVVGSHLFTNHFLKTRWRNNRIFIM